MDFTGSIINEFRGLPDFWWLRLMIAAIGGGLIWILLAKIKERKINRRDVVICGLLTAYVVFILMETVIGRNLIPEDDIDGRFQLLPFWSYIAVCNGRPELVPEILLNYVLFIPFGFLLALICREANIRHFALYGLMSSSVIEISQLVLGIGLFEFDDMIGNMIGTIIGAVVAKRARKAKLEISSILLRR